MRVSDIVDRVVKYILLVFALISVVIVFLIGLFTLREGLPAFQEIGLKTFLLGDWSFGEFLRFVLESFLRGKSAAPAPPSIAWRPGEEQFTIVSMIAGSVLVTVGAIVLGVPLSLGCAIFLAEIAPDTMRSIVRPAVELLAGIPSVVYGLFGMVVIVPIIRQIPVPGNSGFGLLAASIVLAVMILPTITNIAEDAIRAVPREYREGSFALGSTHWQTIVHVIVPAARSGIIAAIILGIGRALGETMAMIMVIGNSVVFPTPLNNNPLTVFLRQTRTLTGNIAVEIAYATGLQESALFATGVVLFALIMFVNTVARLLMRRREA